MAQSQVSITRHYTLQFRTHCAACLNLWHLASCAQRQKQARCALSCMACEARNAACVHLFWFRMLHRHLLSCPSPVGSCQ